MLVVDDDARILHLVSLMLTSGGYRVLKARDPEEAVRMFDQQFGEIDMLLSDFIMPGMSGPELELRLHARKPGLPVLFMTGTPERAAIKTRVLEKPFCMHDLFESVAETLAHCSPTRADFSPVEVRR